MKLHFYPEIRLPSPVMSLVSRGDGACWAGGVGGVAYYNGETWQPRISTLPLTGIAALAHGGGQTLIAGGMEGLARSSDGGLHWELARVEGEMPGITALALAPDFQENGIALAGTMGAGVLRTESSGADWTAANFGLQNLEVLALVWLDADTALAGTPDGVFRSPNAGRAWRFTDGSDGLTVVAFAVLDNGIILAALEDGGLLRSKDGGETWKKFASDLPKDAQISALCVVENKTLLAGTTSDGIFRSTDGGATWTHMIDGAVLSMHCTKTDVFAGLATGVLASADGGQSWTAMDTPPVHDLRHIVYVKGRLLVGGRYSILMRYDDSAEIWQPVTDAPLPMTMLHALDNGTLFAAGPDGLMRSADAGDTWNTVVAGGAGHIGRMTLLDDGNGGTQGWAASADGGYLLRTHDGGQTWEMSNSPFGILPVVALQAVQQTTDPLVFAATYDARRRIAQFWRSTDGGVRWHPGAEVQTHWPLVATYDAPPMLALPGSVLVQHPDGNWQRAKIEVPGGAIVRAITGAHDQLYALTTAGILQSTDHGQTWTPVEGIDLPADQMMDFARDGDDLYVLLVGGVVCRVEL